MSVWDVADVCSEGVRGREKKVGGRGARWRREMRGVDNVADVCGGVHGV
jgi:hypothetical protein